MCVCWMDEWINEWLTECEAHNIFTDWMNVHDSYLGNTLSGRLFENKQLPIWQHISCILYINNITDVYKNKDDSRETGSV